MVFLTAPDLTDYLYGYNVDEVFLPDFDDTMQQGASISKVRSSNPAIRFPEFVSLPSRIVGATYPCPNSSDSLSAARGLQKRLLHVRPTINQRTLRKFKKFVWSWLRDNMVPLVDVDVRSFEEWVSEINQPDWRKEEYRQAHDQMNQGLVSEHKIRRKKCFVKREFYDSPKYHRIIHSPSDYEKVLEGRFISAIESKLFSRPEFIKKVPRDQWPEYISERVGAAGWRFLYGSDYTSFEANFVPELQQASEMALVDYMLVNFRHDPGFRSIKTGAAKGKGLSGAHFEAKHDGQRESGRMSTSLFNGFGNIMFNMFVIFEKLGATDCKYVVEGDDGLFAHNGRRNATPEDFLELGLTIKIEPVDAWYKASFCGVVTHPEVKKTLTNPVKVLCTAAWAGSEYLRANKQTLNYLAQIKGLSYLAQYPGCPVVQSIALWMLRTTGFERHKWPELQAWISNQRSTGYWDSLVLSTISDKMTHSGIMPAPVDDRSRAVVAEVFKVSIEMQLQLEQLFDTDTTGVVHIFPGMVPREYTEHYNTYVRSSHRLDKELNFFHCPPTPDQPNLGNLGKRGDYVAPDPRNRCFVDAPAAVSRPACKKGVLKRRTGR